MQKIFLVRASQKDLIKGLDKLIQKGIKVISITRGSEWWRIGLSYRWTVVLEISDEADLKKAEYEIEQMENDLSTSSIGKAVIFCCVVTAVLTICGLITYFAISCAVK